jgi:DNA-binding PadR family transcriptional regulator
MSLRYAILTALNERPATGLELARRFDRSIGYFWSASHQQIYRDTERLESEGWIHEIERPERPERGQPRRFAITDAGRRALTAWVEQVDDPDKPRDALLVRVRAAGALGAPHVRDAVAHHLAVHEQTLRTYREIEARDFAADDPSPAAALLHVVLRGGIEVEETWVRWCREVLDLVDGVEQKAGGESADIAQT